MAKICYMCLEEMTQGGGPSIDDNAVMGGNSYGGISQYKPDPKLCSFHMRQLDEPGDETGRTFDAARRMAFSDI